MVEEPLKWEIAAQHRQRALAGASKGTLCVCQLPGGPSLNQICKQEKLYVLNSV
jgi:hypothetical protein